MNKIQLLRISEETITTTKIQLAGRRNARHNRVFIMFFWADEELLQLCEMFLFEKNLFTNYFIYLFKFYLYNV